MKTGWWLAGEFALMAVLITLVLTVGHDTYGPWFRLAAGCAFAAGVATITLGSRGWLK